ncbi:MAG: S9 family peptidase [Gemmatimonadota bacterium]|nr:MAG: S9 family peptidase [Gemmatimonadota bacterium]
MSARRMFTLVTALLIAANARAQVPQLSVEGIFGSDDFRTDLASIDWMADGRHYATVDSDDGGHTSLYQVEVVSGRRTLLIDGSELVPAGDDRHIAIDSYTFSPDSSSLLIATDVQQIWRRSREATYYVWDFRAKTLTPVSSRPGYQRYAKFSPDGLRVAFVRDNDIYVTDLSTGLERALTFDGNGDIINGTTDWVYEEELSLSDGFRWSPDGRRIAYWRFNQSNIPTFYLLDESKLYPELIPVRYPKSGTRNSDVKLAVVELGSGRTTWIDVGPASEEFYIARMDFADSPDEIWFQRLNRHQNRMDLLLADVRTGQSRLVMSDSDEAWLDLSEPVWIDGGRKFLYTSERDGFAQLYLYERDGSLIRKVTTAEWEVTETFGVDEDEGVVYYTGAGEGPSIRPLYRVGLDGEGLTRLSDASGRHRIEFDPTFTYYLDTYSSAGVPPVQIIRTVTGDPVRTLADNTVLADKLEALRLRRPEFLKIPIDEAVELEAWLIKPPDFDPTRRYPLLMYVYGGPGSQTVTDAWGGDRYLWHQLLASAGFLVASVDNRGTGARGARFKKVTYLNLGAYESADQIAAARYFAGLPYVDGSRIAIWGWSYGGYMAALSLFKGADVFKAGISVAPVTDWRLYDTIYTERYMRTPEENPEGYAASAPLAYADQLSGRFLLIHGTADDNVHPQNSTQLVQRLIEADKQFELRFYPNKAHSISGSTTRVNLYTLMTRFLKENL